MLDTRTCAAFRKFHPKAQIWQGDAYPIFAKLASQHTGLYFLDSTNSLTDMLASSSVLIDKRWEWLWCFGYNARPNTFLAYNLTFDRPRIGGHIQNYTYGEVDKQVNRFKKELMDCLGKGWEMAEVYQYRSTHHSAMITFMCYKR